MGREPKKDGTAEETPKDLNEGVTPHGTLRMLAALEVMEMREKELQSLGDMTTERERLVQQFRPQSDDRFSAERTKSKQEQILAALSRPLRQPNKRQRETGVDLTPLANNKLQFNAIRKNQGHEGLLRNECVAWGIETNGVGFKDLKALLKEKSGDNSYFEPKTEGMMELSQPITEASTMEE